MPNYNKTIMIGHITRDIETKQIPSGKTVGNTAIAVNNGFGDKKEVCFMECELWGKTAETAAQYLRKGAAVLFEGYIKQDTWEKDGKKQSRHKLVVNSMSFMSGKNDKDDGELATAKRDVDNSDNLPF